ncbi:MAG: TonB-dependent receptor [Pseudomonadales bacterium]
MAENKKLIAASVVRLCSPVLLLGMLLGQYVVAEEYVTEIDVFDDIPLVNAGTRLEQRLTEVPASITIIDREMIAASGATEIPHLFRLVPGFLSYSVFGNQFGVSARGISPEFPGHLEIMVNGRTVYQPALATMEWTTLGVDIKDIDYIEVVRGSNTPAYGSNAFLGAIHIVTIDPVTAPRASARVVGGSLDTHDASVSYSDQVRDFSYGVTFGSRSNDGFDDKGLRRDGLSSRHIRLSGLYTPTLNDEIEVFLGLSQSHIERARRDVRGYHNREINSNYQQISWKHLLGNGDVKVNFHHNYGQIDDDTVLGLFSDAFGMTPAAAGFPLQADEVIFSDIRGGFSERYDLELEHTLAVSPDINFVWGSGVRLDRLKSLFLIGDNDVVDEQLYRLFGNLDWHFHERWNANFGVMIEHNNIVTPFASPRVGVNYRFSPAHMLRASATAGKRTPSVLNANQNQSVRFADGTVIDQVISHDEKTKAERVNAFEFGYLGYFFNGDLSLDAKLFHEQVRDVRHFPLRAASDINSFVFVRENGLAWDTRGFEAQVRYRANNKWLFSWQYAYTNIDGRAPKDISNQVPLHNTSLLAAYKPVASWQVSGVLYHTSEMTWTRGDAVDDITRLDLRLAKKLRVGQWQGQLEFLIHNIGDDYADYDQDNVFERRLFVRLQFDLE